MRRSGLEHLIRAAGRIADEHELVIIGSQAILGQFPYASRTRIVDIHCKSTLFFISGRSTLCVDTPLRSQAIGVL
jgi:hypothetical protein